MTTRPYLRPLILGHILVVLIASLSLPASSAIGVYNFTASVTASALPISIAYRLNTSGNVTIEIHNSSDAVVATLGPFSESIGVHIHTWDNGGAGLAGGNYRALIRATNDGGSPSLLGTMVPMFADRQCASTIYGLTIDRFAESPGYGTIYVSKASGGGYLMAYYADGTPKDWPSANATGNSLSLNLGSSPASDPWGIGVDKLGNIYVSSTQGVANPGVAVFDYQGNKLPYVLQTDPAGIVWLDGLATSSGLEVYETKGSTVRYSQLSGDHWTTAMDPGLSGASIKANQICFETGGSACYVATSGTSTDSQNPNPGVTRFVRQLNGTWAKDTSFQCGLTSILLGVQLATRFATGVSCDARDPDGNGPWTASTLWIGLAANSNYGNNLVRTALPGGATTVFAGPDAEARFVAADSVGNVAYEYGSTAGPYPQLWSYWGMRSPGGEASSDARLTNWVAIAGTAQRKIVTRIRDLKLEAPESQVQLSSVRRVTAVFGDCFYIEEDDRTCGIMVKCASAVSEGSLVKVGGRITSDQGERYLADAEILPP